MINASQRIARLLIGGFFRGGELERLHGFGGLALFKENPAQQSVGFGRLRIEFERGFYALSSRVGVTVLFQRVGQIIYSREILRAAFGFFLEGRDRPLLWPS